MKEQIVVQLREQMLADEGVRSTIAMRAYEIYQDRGGESGGDLDDWLQAENEILTVLLEQPSGGDLDLSGTAETEEIANQVKPSASEAATVPARPRKP